MGEQGRLVKIEMVVSLSKHLKTVEHREMALVPSGEPLSYGSHTEEAPAPLRAQLNSVPRLPAGGPGGGRCPAEGQPREREAPCCGLAGRRVPIAWCLGRWPDTEKHL